MGFLSIPNGGGSCGAPSNFPKGFLWTSFQSQKSGTLWISFKFQGGSLELLSISKGEGGELLEFLSISRNCSSGFWFTFTRGKGFLGKGPWTSFQFQRRRGGFRLTGNPEDPPFEIERNCSGIPPPPFEIERKSRGPSPPFQLKGTPEEPHPTQKVEGNPEERLPFEIERYSNNPSHPCAL